LAKEIATNLEDKMGNKPSNIFQQDRPESGGADHDDERETSGLLDRAKQEFAESQAKKRTVPTKRSVDKSGKSKSR
jgi:hypothetical protein